MRRFIDLLLVLFIAIVALPIALLITLLIKITSKGSVLYWSDRVGCNNKLFKMPKFRSMKTNTPIVATHLLKNPQKMLTPVGSFLRKSSLDELPQLWSVLMGDMRFVGPRPALFNQSDLIALRTEYGVHKLVPGITGWAQVNGRDKILIPAKVALDVEYLQQQCISFDMKVLLFTFKQIVGKNNITH